VVSTADYIYRAFDLLGKDILVQKWSTYKVIGANYEEKI
jgi:hypothetical protein